MPATAMPCISRRRAALTTLLALASAPALRAQSSGEAALRETIERHVAAWNRHDLEAWAAFLTADADVRDYAHGPTGREAAKSLWGHHVRHNDLRWDIVRIKMAPGDATVLLRSEIGVPPRKDGQYKSVFRDDPVVSRWRLEDGQWRMYFFTSFKPRANEIVRSEGLE